MNNSSSFRLKAGEFRNRAGAADTPLARQRLEETAKRFESLADELDGASPATEEAARLRARRA